MIIIIGLFILIFILFYILNNKFKNINEYFNECKYTIGSPCQTDSYYGIYNNECKCISYNISTNKLITKSLPLYNEIEKIEEVEENEESNEINEENNILDDCDIDNQDFDKYCKKINRNYGIKKFQKCKNNKYKIECDEGYIGGIKYPSNITITPCLDNNLDFDSLCKYYNNKSVPEGYDINSIGSQKILKGYKGDCYSNNGLSDNKSRAICDYNHYKTINKLGPSVFNKNYNIFTDCLPSNSNFINNCKNKINIDNNNIKAVEIMGYDCLPGFKRAKCI